MSGHTRKKFEAIEDSVHAILNSHEDSHTEYVAAAICKGILAYMMQRSGGDISGAKRLLDNAFHLAMTQGPSNMGAKFNNAYSTNYDPHANIRRAEAERARAEQYAQYGNNSANSNANFGGGTFNEENLRDAARRAGLDGDTFDAMFGFKKSKPKAPPPPSPPPPPTGAKRWWEVLGVSQHADRATIKGAWRKKIKTAHPDAGGDAEAAQTLNAAKAEGLRVVRA